MAVISLDDIKAFLRYDTGDTSNDTALNIILAGGQSWIERYTNHLFTYREVVDNPKAIGDFYDLRWKPADIDSVYIDYLDSLYALQTFSAIATYDINGIVRIVPTVAFPTGSVGINVTYNAGYSDVDDIPPVMLHALSVYAAMSDEERAGGMNYGWEAMKNLLIDFHTPVIV